MPVGSNTGHLCLSFLTIENLTNCTIEHYSSSGPVLYLFISCPQQSYFYINKYLFAFLKDYILPELFWTLWGFFCLCQQPYESCVSCFANSCLFDDWFHLFQQKLTEEQMTVEQVKVPCWSGVARSSFIWKHTLPAKADALEDLQRKGLTEDPINTSLGLLSLRVASVLFVWCLPKNILTVPDFPPFLVPRFSPASRFCSSPWLVSPAFPCPPA